LTGARYAKFKIILGDADLGVAFRLQPILQQQQHRLLWNRDSDGEVIRERRNILYLILETLFKVVNARSYSHPAGSNSQ
jgi:hypothetical protein